MQMTRLSLLATLLLIGFVEKAGAEYVIPQMGGGQVGQGAAPMKHADITFDGQNLHVQVDPTVATPMLRPLEVPNEFDPSQAWSVLGTKAYNFQYGWNPGGFISLPSGSWIWIEQLDATTGLEVYQRPPAAPAYDPVFGTVGSSLRWRWNGSMTHNVYAVQDPTLSLYEATYRVYLGDNSSGEPLPGYGTADVVFQFGATPLSLAGDYNGNGLVDAADYSVWRDALTAASTSLLNDPTPGTVDESDFAYWRDHYGEVLGAGAGVAGSASASSAVPEPTSALLATVAGALITLIERRSFRDCVGRLTA